MKSGQMSVKTFLVVFIFFLMAGAITKAVAENEITMPPVGDYVLRFTTTDTKEKEYYGMAAGEETIAIAPNAYTSARTAAQYFEGFNSVQIKIIVFENEIKLANRVDYWAAMEGVLPLKFHEIGYNEALGRETFFQKLSFTKGFVDGEYTDVSFKNPTRIMYIALYDDRVILEVEFQKEDEELTEADITQVNEFVKTISVTYEDIFDTEADTYVYSTPTLMIHLSPGKFTQTSAELLVPKNWIVEETALIEATTSLSQPVGMIILDIAPYEEPTPGIALEKLYISIEGLLDGKLKTATYKEKGAQVLARIIPSPQKLSSKDVSDQMEEFMFGAHCLSDYAGSANSKGVKSTTYEGLNDEGLPVKVLHLSAGGYYLACNYIYSASPERFDQNLDMVMGILEGLRVEFLGPPLKR